MDEFHTRLRVWARGIHPTEAATELLIRTGFARAGNPWVRREPSGGTAPDDVWIDFAEIPAHVGPLSSGERRVPMFAASKAERLPAGDLRPRQARDAAAGADLGRGQPVPRLPVQRGRRGP